MFKINRRTDYAVRVVLALARQAEGARLSTAEIQTGMLVPPAFIQRIVAELARSGLIQTFPGREGGLQLARPAEEITLKDVIEAVEGPILLSDCLSVAEACPLNTPCRVSAAWGRLQGSILRELSAINFAQLALEPASLSVS